VPISVWWIKAVLMLGVLTVIASNQTPIKILLKWLNVSVKTSQILGKEAGRVSVVLLWEVQIPGPVQNCGAGESQRLRVMSKAA